MTTPEIRNAGFFEMAYILFWAIHFAYLLFLHRKLARIGKEDSRP
jgi:hypothetical protein